MLCVCCFHSHQQTAAVGYELTWRKKWSFPSVEYHLLDLEIHQYAWQTDTRGQCLLQVSAVLSSEPARLTQRRL